jgi:hypothetical protein
MASSTSSGRLTSPRGQPYLANEIRPDTSGLLSCGASDPDSGIKQNNDELFRGGLLVEKYLKFIPSGIDAQRRIAVFHHSLST